MLRFVLAFVLIVGGATSSIVWLTHHPSATSTTAITLISLAAILAMAMAAFHFLWRPMLVDYPAVEPAPDAVRRNFQSFGIGIVNMGLSIHVAVDETYLHLTPFRLWRLLGASPASIPWSVMEPVGSSGRVVRFDGRRMDGPKWCMELAQPE